MYNTILVPLDGSKRAEAILPQVEELAQQCNAKVVLVQVLDPIPVVTSLDGTTMAVDPLTIERMEKKAEEYLVSREGALHEKGIQAETHLTCGEVVPTILETAQREDADLIALASHGRSGLSRALFGSVAAGILQGANRPLLLVRSR